MTRRAGLAGVFVVLALTGCQGDGGSTPHANPFATATPEPTPTTSPSAAPDDPNTTPTTRRQGPSVAPPGIDPTVLHDLTGGNNAQMLGLWRDTVVLASSNAEGQNVLQGHAVSTGEKTWEYTVESTLGTGATPSAITSELQYDAVSVLETASKDRLDKVGRLTLLDPTRGTVRHQSDIPEAKSFSSFAPFGVAVQRWSEPVVIHLPDGRQLTMPSTDTDWLIPSPRGTKPWAGVQGVWPGTSQDLTTEVTESASWSRALRRTEDDKGEVLAQVLDTVSRTVIAQGCAGQLGSDREFRFSPSRTWATIGTVSVEVDTATLHCNPELAEQTNAKVLAVNDQGRLLAASGYGTSRTYFLAPSDGRPQQLDGTGTDSTFDPDADTLSQTLAMTDDLLVVGGQTFALPQESELE